MKLKQHLSLLLCLVLLCGVLAGCGSTSSTETAAVASNKSLSYDAAAAEEYYEAESGAALTAGGADTGSTAQPENRKWIITIDMYVETEDLDTLMERLNADITSLAGYVEDQSVYNGSTYASRRYRSANLTVRIPAESTDQFSQCISGIANVVSQNLNREDITLQYVATESRLTALETEEARLLELLAQAETMSDLLEIEERLTDVRYELENYASQKRLYDNQIDYATIYLTIEEVQEYTPVEEPTLWERISGGFMDSLKGLGEGTLDLLVWLITSSPYLAALAVLIVLLLLLVKRARKSNAKKKAKIDKEQK